MMNNVLFTHAYFYPLDSKQWKLRQPYPPLGTLLAAAVTREAGFDVSLWDANLEEGPSRFFPMLEVTRPEYVVLYDDGFNYLTKMCLTTMREAAFSMIEAARKQGVVVIVCSSDAADHYVKYLDHGAGFVIRGEGEETLRQLLTTLSMKKDVQAIEGIAFRRNGEVIVNAARHVMRNLDKLPLPAWDLVDMDAYRRIWIKHHGYFSLNIATTRGCSFKCNWCAKPIYGNRYNSRSPENVVNEIALLLDRYEPDHFWMSDDIFGLKPGWVQRFGGLLAARKLTIRYKIQSRVDLLLREDTIKSLSVSGADTVWVGAESGAQKILDAMDKQTTVEQIATAAALLKRYGIKTGFFLQFGYPGETMVDIGATLKMVLGLMPDEIGISVAYPLPGTPFYEKVRDQFRGKENWKDSDDLAMMFQGTYGARFYKRLHRYIHNRYRIHRGWLFLQAWVRRPGKPDLRVLGSMIYNILPGLLNRIALKRLEMRHG